MHCIPLLWESQEWRLEPNILTWCVGFRPFFPQSLPRFHPSDRAAAPIGKNIHLTVPFLRRGFSPRFSVLRANPARAVFLNMPIFTCKLIMNLFVHFVNIFTQKIVKTARTEAVCVFKKFTLIKSKFDTFPAA